MMEIFRQTKAYKLAEGDLRQGRLSHAYLLLLPDAGSLGGCLRLLAQRILSDGLPPREAERVSRLVAENRFEDCRFFPAEGEKCGVAEVKAMLGECYVKPAEAARKVFVLSRVHEMLPAAQNKLLKVLEEPPANVVFLLGSASEYAVLPTVRSRAKRLEVQAFPEQAIEAYVRERYPARQDAKEIAALSGGLPGRADELAQGGSVAEACEKAVLLALNLSPASVPLAARSFANREEAARALALLRLVFRDLLMLRLGREDLLLSGADRALLAKAGRRYSAGALVRAIGRIAQSERELRANAVVPMCIEALLHGILEDR